SSEAVDHIDRATPAGYDRKPSMKITDKQTVLSASMLGVLPECRIRLRHGFGLSESQSSSQVLGSDCGKRLWPTAPTHFAGSMWPVSSSTRARDGIAHSASGS